MLTEHQLDNFDKKLKATLGRNKCYTKLREVEAEIEEKEMSELLKSQFLYHLRKVIDSIETETKRELLDKFNY